MNWDWLVNILKNDPALTAWVAWMLTGGGIGIIVKLVVDWLKDNYNPSPRSTRWLAYGVSFVIPTVVYALYCVMGGAFLLSSYIGAILSAFAASQALHGKTELPTGEDLRKAGVVDEEALENSNVTIVK